MTIIAVIVIGFPLLMYLAQDSLIFHPQRLPEAHRVALAQRRSVESLFIDSPDGTRLHAWHVKGEPLIMYFGGNAEEVSWMLNDAAGRAPGIRRSGRSPERSAWAWRRRCRSAGPARI